MPTFHTRVSEVGPGSVNLRGYSLADVMRHLTYAEGSFLTIIGRLPTPEERRLVDVILNSLLDHGYVASTVTAARYIASGNPQFVPAVAGGLLAAGSNTLSPEHSYHLLESAAELRTAQGMDFAEAAREVVEGYVKERRRLPGFGHPVHKSSDFRSDIVFEFADSLGLAGDGIRQFAALHEAFVSITGKQNIPINIDGALAAVGSDLGWSSDQTVAFALLSVLPGLMGHVIEELSDGVPLRHIEDGDYIGKPEATLPVGNPITEGAS